MGNFKRINESRARYEKTQEDTNTKMQAASTKSGINWKKWLVYGATALVAVTVGYYSYKAWYSPLLAETASLDDGEVLKAEETHLAFLQEAKLGEFMGAPTVIEIVNTRWSTMVGDKNSKAYKKVEVEPAVAGNMFGYGGKAAITKQVKKTAEEMKIALKQGQTDADLFKPDFALDEDQVKDVLRETADIKNMELSADAKTEAALAFKQAKVDAVNHSWTGARNQALGVAGVPTAAVGLTGYWAYNKWCSKKDDKPVDQKPAYKKPVDNRRQNTDPNARTPYNTAGDRTNTKTDGSKTQVEGGDDTKTNKADKKSGMPGWAIFLIVFAIVAVIGAVVYFVFFTSKDEDEEFDNEL